MVFTTTLSFAFFGTPLDIFTVLSAAMVKHACACIDPDHRCAERLRVACMQVGAGVALYSRPMTAEKAEYLLLPNHVPLEKLSSNAEPVNEDGRRGD